jgi:hypothetical protein
MNGSKSISGRFGLGVKKGCHNQTCVNCQGIFPKGQVLSERGILRSKGQASC